jgi:hypothetical protein
MLTVVRLSDDSSLRRRIVFGEPTELRSAGRHREALVPPSRLVAYLVERDRARALFVFRTAPSGDGVTSTIAGVSPGVNLLLLASTSRAVRKAMNALRFLRRQLGPRVNELSDLFWLRFADFACGRRATHVLAHVADLLRAEPALA